MGPLRSNAKQALVPDSDGEYGLAKVAYKGTEKQCESWAKFTYKPYGSCCAKNLRNREQSVNTDAARISAA